MQISTWTQYAAVDPDGLSSARSNMPAIMPPQELTLMGSSVTTHFDTNKRAKRCYTRLGRPPSQASAWQDLGTGNGCPES